LIAHDGEDGDGDSDHKELVDGRGAGELGEEEPERRRGLRRFKEGEESPAHPGGIAKHGDVGVEKVGLVFAEAFSGTAAAADDAEFGAALAGGEKEGNRNDAEEEPDGEMGVDQESAGVNADDETGGNDEDIDDRDGFEIE